MNFRRELHFEWDGAKALSNERKHGVAFTLAVTVFRDPRIQTMFDEEHSELVRIVSARRANTTERAAYEERR